jgi:hypothetical protein
MTEEEIIKKHYEKLGKLSHEKSPRSPEYFREIQRKSVAKRRLNKAKLSPVAPAKKLRKVRK